jgi:hypothetical protein
VGQAEERIVRDRREPPRRAKTAAQARLATDLGASIDRTRMAWEAASLRGDAALRVGDRAEAVRALDEQRALLRDLHLQVDEALGRAAVEREAETIVDAAAHRDQPSIAADLPSRRRGPAGAVTGAVLAAALGLAALVPSSPPVPEVGGVASDLPAVDASTGGDADRDEVVAAPSALSDVEVAGGSDALATAPVAFERVTEVLGELQEALVGSDRRNAVARGDGVDETTGDAGPAVASDEAEGEVAPDAEGADAPELTPAEGLKGALDPDREDGEHQPSDPPGRLDLNGRLGGGDDGEGGEDGEERDGVVDGIAGLLDRR